MARTAVSSAMGSDGSPDLYRVRKPVSVKIEGPPAIPGWERLEDRVAGTLEVCQRNRMQAIPVGNQNLVAGLIISAGNDNMAAEMIFMPAEVEVRQESHIYLEHDWLVEA